MSLKITNIMLSKTVCEWVHIKKPEKNPKNISLSTENGRNEGLLQPMDISGSADTVILCAFYVSNILASIVNKNHVWNSTYHITHSNFLKKNVSWFISTTM